jgi:hypothetical protein
MRLLRAMGAELANVHAHDPEASAKVRAHLPSLTDAWLQHAAEKTADATVQDWKAYRQKICG